MNVKELGAVGDGVTDDTEAFQKAVGAIALTGGTIQIPSGVYRVGRQTFMKSFGAGNSFRNEPILTFKDVKRAIRVIGTNAVLKANDNLKYGSFNPVSGLPDSARAKGHQSDYYASAYELISAENCDSIYIDGLELDGNFDKLQIGPGFGNINIQLAAIGIRLSQVKNVQITNTLIHHCGLDGITVVWNGLDNDAPLYPHVFENVEIKYCGRQALSFVGGNSLIAKSCTFSHTGILKRNSTYFFSPPSAGIDLECEDAIIKNLKFLDCVIADNTGPGLSTIGHPLKDVVFERCTFIGTTNSAVYPKSSGISFFDCTFIGKIERLFGSEKPELANKFRNCIFTYEQPTGVAFSILKEQHEFYETTNIVFDQCSFDFGDLPMPRSSGKEATFRNCNFQVSNNSNRLFSARFIGTNIMNTKGLREIDLRGVKNSGLLRINGRRVNTENLIMVR